MEIPVLQFKESVNIVNAENIIFDKWRIILSNKIMEKTNERLRIEELEERIKELKEENDSTERKREYEFCIKIYELSLQNKSLINNGLDFDEILEKTYKWFKMKMGEI